MAVKVARGQVTIIDQNDAVTLQAFIGSSQPLTQVYNKDTNAYAPSWSASPYLILTPSLFVSGKGSTDQITSVGNAASLTAGVKSENKIRRCCPRGSIGVCILVINLC